MTMTDPTRCIFPGCVSTDRHTHGGFPGGYTNPADPEGPPIEFTSEPSPGVRDDNGALLADHPDPTRALADPALYLAALDPRDKHGQMCPVWREQFRHKKRGGPATIAECECWILADRRLDIAALAAQGWRLTSAQDADDSLDAAWREAEAGWNSLHGHRLAVLQDETGEWHAIRSSRTAAAQKAVVLGEAVGPTPATALRALAAKLRERAIGGTS